MFSMISQMISNFRSNRGGRWRHVIALTSLVVICAVSPAVNAQEMTLRFEAWPIVNEVTFDAARTPVEDVRRWMQLADHISNENGYQVPFWLEQCYRDDPRYVPCGGEPPSINVNNARLNLEKIRTVLANLDPNAFPPDLSPVVLYLREIQIFALWKETQRLEFAQTGDVARLEAPFQTIDPKVACKASLDRIRGGG